jgi:hypothetical protein
VAEYVRLSRAAPASGLTVTFEDGLMDIALYREGALQVCVEVKERNQLHGRLLLSHGGHGAAIWSSCGFGSMT